MQARPLHPWRVSYREAVGIQEALRERVRFVPLSGSVRLVAGTDVSYSRPTHRMYAAVVLVSLPSLEVVETAEATCSARFPYIPGLFTFREVPPLLEAFRRLKTRPDAILFDGHGLAHPRRFGLACHAGLLLETPSVGCAKSRLVGTHGRVGSARGAVSPLEHQGQVIGTVMRTRPGVKPVYVSPGHLADLASSVALVRDTCRRYRLPEPIRLAHRATTEMRCRLDRTAPQPHDRTYPDFVSARVE